jgi:SpoVK/Ycf46/Vps4 family AAA+-type ATPase
LIVEDGRLGADDIAHVIAAKKAIVEREGVLEYYPAEETLDDLAGLDGLKAWLAKRRNIVTDPKRAAAFGLTFPKGILLIGVPGCGKSLCARAVASEWGLPLLRLDPGSLYNKYIGETEKNLRRACSTAERLAPVVLFIDEIEKAFAGGGEDGGVSQRVLGSFLAWLQDRRANVFTVATANDVSRLPPELLRKGRFDEVFFVDLPTAVERRAIVTIHLRRRNRAAGGFDVDAIASAADGFSGAEIEQAIVAALYTAFAEERQLTTDGILAEVRATRPLSVTMAERVAALRAWAATRAVPTS